jgi:hypothetical protein
MAYVDLNPVRAGMAETPEQSEPQTGTDLFVHSLADTSREPRGKKNKSVPVFFYRQKAEIRVRHRASDREFGNS